MAGGGNGVGEWLRQWWACHDIVGAAAVQRLHIGIVGAGGGRQACCGVYEAAAGPQWQGGMMEAAGVRLYCHCLGGVVIKIVLLNHLLLVSHSLLCDEVCFLYGDSR